VSLPLPLRNRLSELIVDSCHDADARRALEMLAGLGADGRAISGGVGVPERFPLDWFESRSGELRIKSGWTQHAGELRERAGRAWHVLGGRPLDPPDAPLGSILEAAALLFDARLYFEVHELLEPYWTQAKGAEREALQGLIQIAVGYQHFANGNEAGARALLAEGAARLHGRALGAAELEPFAHAVARSAASLPQIDWAMVPAFPAG
jgi:Domain of unknown function (DUF309)